MLNSSTDFTHDDEYDHVSINTNGTLHIEHFNIKDDNMEPVIGTGIKG